MIPRLSKPNRRAAAVLLHAAACLISVAMLLSFPMRTTHRYGEHYRTPVTRRSILRDTFVAGPEAGTADQGAPTGAVPAPSAAMLAESAGHPPVAIMLVSGAPVIRPIVRRKLGPPRADASEPPL